LQNIQTSYTKTAVVLHWLITGLLIFNISLAVTDDWWPESSLRFVIDLHKSIGITVLFLVLVRIAWRLTHRPPQLPEELPQWEKRNAYTGHFILYALILMIPVSGWLHDSAWKAAATHPMFLFGVVPWPRIDFIMNLDPVTKESVHDFFSLVHNSLNILLGVVLSIHVLAVIKHEYIDHISVFHRMTFRKRSKENT
jgi:cytochrome b561